MTRLTNLTLCAAVALTPALAAAQGFTTRLPGGDPTARGLTTTVTGAPHTQSRSNRSMWDIACGDDNWIAIWEEDENGQEVPGTFHVDCLPPEG